MEELKTLTSELTRTVGEAKACAAQNSRPKLPLVGGAVITIISLFLLPLWVTLILMVLLMGYAVMGTQDAAPALQNKLDEIQALTDKLKECQPQTQTECDECRQKDETIAALREQLEQLKSAPAPAPVPQEGMPSLAELNQNSLLRKLQSLDIEVSDFGDECATYIRKEFGKVLRNCGFEFVDYSEETKAMFDVETAAIDSYDCTARAIATRTEPQRVVIRGHAFIPE